MRLMPNGAAVAFLAAGLTALGTVTAAAAPATGQQDHGALVVHTDKGAVGGVSADGVDSFLGIPYAAPPAGGLRWHPPQPAARWTGVHAADRYGNRCPALASTNGPRSETEDCLFLNVQRPADVHSGQGLPVYFWIHGGGLLNGSSNQHDGSKIVRETGVVVVTINYRLGVFGFLGHPALTAEEDGNASNYGFEDQQAALRWVHRNIAAFGGDPERVTIGGESAGGWSVCAHLSAPGSRGLFIGAMIQSGSCASRTEAAADSQGASVANAVGCTDAATVLSCLRQVPASRLLEAWGGTAPMFVRGTAVLPLDPRVAVHDGQFARVPVVNGANRDEGRTFTQGFIGATEARYVATVRGIFGANADAVLAHYPWPADADRFTAAYLLGAIFTDSGLVAGIGGCTTRALSQDFARYTRTYAYEFDHRTGPGLTPIPGYVWGAGHAAELAYLWPSFDNGTPIAPRFNRAERQLASEMVQWWGAFVRGGRPDVEGQTDWPRYDRSGQVLSLRAGGQSTAISDAAYLSEHMCGFWNSLPSST